MPSPPLLDPRLCPLCGAPNGCAMEVERATGLAQGPCWCMTTDFDATALQRIPETARGQACICARCAAPIDGSG